MLFGKFGERLRSHRRPIFGGAVVAALIGTVITVVFTVSRATISSSTDLPAGAKVGTIVLTVGEGAPVTLVVPDSLLDNESATMTVPLYAAGDHGGLLEVSGVPDISCSSPSVAASFKIGFGGLPSLDSSDPAQSLDYGPAQSKAHTLLLARMGVHALMDLPVQIGWGDLSNDDAGASCGGKITLTLLRDPNPPAAP